MKRSQAPGKNDCCEATSIAFVAHISNVNVVVHLVNLVVHHVNVVDDVIPLVVKVLMR
jgi:hypothetical protein